MNVRSQTSCDGIVQVHSYGQGTLVPSDEGTAWHGPELAIE